MYIVGIYRTIQPHFITQARLKKKLSQLSSVDQEYIFARVNYYNKLNACNIGSGSCLKDFKLVRPKAYFFDTHQYTRFFNDSLKINYCFGDVTHIPENPSLVKSRPIKGENQNSVLLNLDKKRHFVFLKDKKQFIDKKNILLFRAAVHQEHRMRFMKMYYNKPLFDIGQINKRGGYPEMLVDKISIDEHLDYKFILCLEGNDVATNLKWVMSSNSLAVMPEPTYETWFMEGTLIPNYHYVKIKDDYSDVEERMQYYIAHPEEALEIIKHANEYTKQFQNKKREDLISLLVLKKYFENTGQRI